LPDLLEETARLKEEIKSIVKERGGIIRSMMLACPRDEEVKISYDEVFK
jgi:hypothetical protein